VGGLELAGKGHHVVTKVLLQGGTEGAIDAVCFAKIIGSSEAL
jgi:hypothetical protein